MLKLFKILANIFFALALLLCLIWILVARPTLPQAVDPAAVKVDDKLLYQHVKTLSVDYAPRDFSHLQNLNASAAYIKNQFVQMGLTVTEQKFTVDGEEYKNIITSFGPKTGSKIVIGAHYDAAGLKPAADDNASGIAGLIELARLLKTETFNKNISLVAYTLEEPPYFATESMGSFIHAKSEKESGNKIDLMISLEMIGYFSEEKNSQKFPIKLLNLFYPNKGNFIAIVDQLFSGAARDIKKGMSQYISLPVYSINAPASIPGIDYSDHRNYWAHGYNAVMITDTSFYRNFAYHTDKDTLDRLDYKKMAEVVIGVFSYIKNRATPAN